MYSLIAGGKYRNTSLGRAWLSADGSNVTGKGSMLFVKAGHLQPEFYSSVTTRTTAMRVTQELDLVQQDTLMI